MKKLILLASILVAGCGGGGDPCEEGCAFVYDKCHWEIDGFSNKSICVAECREHHGESDMGCVASQDSCSQAQTSKCLGSNSCIVACTFWYEDYNTSIEIIAGSGATDADGCISYCESNNLYEAADKCYDYVLNTDIATATSKCFP